MKKCNICNTEVKQRKEIMLDGTDDIYNLEVCDKCYDLYSRDYFSPEEIDDLLKVGD